MPIYEYACNECGHRFEKMQAITAEPLTECPNCGKSAIHRVFHPVGVIFKGSGWYITDSRKSGDKGESVAPSADKGKETSATTEKGDSKSETKSETKSEAKSESSGSSEGSSSGASTTSKSSDT